MRTAVLIIPCYNEAARLSADEVAALVADRRIALLFVDDGSKDDTAKMLGALCAKYPDSARALILPHNVGKAEAVRRGLVDALARGATIVGYADADFATSAAELARLLDHLTPHVDAVLGSRVARLGAKIERHGFRHIGGRAFATLAALTLDAPIYDSQCGAKWFRDVGPLRDALSEPFRTRWAFDVELLARLTGRLGKQRNLAVDRIIEVPLEAWHDVRDSKLGIRGMLTGFREAAELFAASRGALRYHHAPPAPKAEGEPIAAELSN